MTCVRVGVARLLSLTDESDPHSTLFRPVLSRPQFVFLCALLWSVSAIASTNPTGKSVLIINDVGLAHPASAVITREVMSELAVDNDYQVEFYVDSLDSTGLPTSSAGRSRISLSGNTRTTSSTRSSRWVPRQLA